MSMHHEMPAQIVHHKETEAAIMPSPHHIVIAAGSLLTYIYEIDLETHDPYHKHFSFTLHADARLLFVPLICGGKELALSCTITLEEGAQATIKGAYAATGSQHYTITTRQEHRGKNSRSDLMFYGIASGQALVTYEGTIEITQDAGGTQAQQENKTILCSQKARAISVPSLEIATNQVQCGHGSAIGPLNKEHMLYLQSRGISADVAKKMVLSGFFYQLFQDSGLIDRVDGVVKKLIMSVHAEDSV